MLNLTSPCCKIEAKYADTNAAQYGCVGCGNPFTLEQGRPAIAPAVEPPVPVADAPAADVAPVADAPAAQ